MDDVETVRDLPLYFPDVDSLLRIHPDPVFDKFRGGKKIYKGEALILTVSVHSRKQKFGTNVLLFIVCPMLCNAWTQYKFTCVCVCVCVSITLSVNSPTGQTLQQIFTVDSLKDADFHKDVPFGSLDDK